MVAAPSAFPCAAAPQPIGVPRGAPCPALCGCPAPGAGTCSAPPRLWGRQGWEEGRKRSDLLGCRLPECCLWSLRTAGSTPECPGCKCGPVPSRDFGTLTFPLPGWGPAQRSWGPGPLTASVPIVNPWKTQRELGLKIHSLGAQTPAVPREGPRAAMGTARKGQGKGNSD